MPAGSMTPGRIGNPADSQPRTAATNTTGASGATSSLISLREVERRVLSSATTRSKSLALVFQTQEIPGTRRGTAGRESRRIDVLGEVVERPVQGQVEQCATVRDRRSRRAPSRVLRNAGAARCFCDFLRPPGIPRRRQQGQRSRPEARNAREQLRSLLTRTASESRNYGTPRPGRIPARWIDRPTCQFYR